MGEMLDYLKWCIFPLKNFCRLCPPLPSSHLCRKVLGREPREKESKVLNWPGYRALPQKLVQENLSQVRSIQDGMQDKGMLIGNHFAWNDNRPSFSFWSSAIIASIVNSRKLVWLKELESPARITLADATVMLIVRERLTGWTVCSVNSWGTPSYFPKDRCLNNPQRLNAETPVPVCHSLRMDWWCGWAEMEKLHLPAEDKLPAIPAQISLRYISVKAGSCASPRREAV